MMKYLCFELNKKTSKLKQASVMAKNSNTTVSSNSFLEDHPVIESTIDWVMENKSKLIWAFVGFCILLMLIYRLITMQTDRAEGEFIRAENLFKKFQAVNASNANELKELTAIMDKYPELKPEYQGAIAQTLLIEGKIQEVQPIAEELFSRGKKDHLALYQDFSKTSLLIAEGKYENALQAANTLNLSLEPLKDKEHYSFLYAVNLVRLAVLHGQLGQAKEEEKAWGQFLALENREVASLVDHAFTLGQFSLGNYIQGRQGK